MTCTTTIFTRYDAQCREFEGHYNYYLEHNDDWNWSIKRDYDTEKYKEMGAVSRFHEKVALLINQGDSEGLVLSNYLQSKINFNQLDSEPLVGMSDNYIYYNEGNDVAFNQLKNSLLKVLTICGRVITFGYHSVSMGEKRGFYVEEICVMSHGGAIHDTIATVEVRYK